MPDSMPSYSGRSLGAQPSPVQAGLEPHLAVAILPRAAPCACGAPARWHGGTAPSALEKQSQSNLASARGAVMIMCIFACSLVCESSTRHCRAKHCCTCRQCLARWHSRHAPSPLSNRLPGTAAPLPRTAVRSHRAVSQRYLGLEAWVQAYITAPPSSQRLYFTLARTRDVTGSLASASVVCLKNWHVLSGIAACTFSVSSPLALAFRNPRACSAARIQRPARVLTVPCAPPP